MRVRFVTSVLNRLVAEGLLGRDESILAVCAGRSEQKLFGNLGFADVTMSNSDERLGGEDFAPFGWSRQDAQALTFEDRQFEFAFVSDGLHHVSRPHQALTEMYRVSRKGIIVIESRDSLIMRLAVRMGLSWGYEIGEVARNDYRYGGVDNGPIPNHIYRWTEREFAKTVRTFDPTGRHGFRFFYGLNTEPPDSKDFTGLKLLAIRLGTPLLWLLTRVFPGQCNTFAMVALRPRVPEDLWPWLKAEAGQIVPDRVFLDRYGPRSEGDGGREG